MVRKILIALASVAFIGVLSTPMTAQARMSGAGALPVEA